MSRISKTSNRAWRVAGAGVGAVAVLGLGYIAKTWFRYGHVAKHRGGPTLLDRFVPNPEVLERHETRVAAPVEETYAAARALNLMASPVVKAIFRGRELLMRASPDEKREPQPLIDEVLALGWVVLAEEPGREIVLGAVTQPWEADVQFHGVAPDEFAACDAPGFAKIAWNIQAESVGPTSSRFCTETRVVTTDAEARKRFRRYWTMVSPGIRLIRRESLRLVRRDAERRYLVELKQEAEGALTWPP